MNRRGTGIILLLSLGMALLAQQTDTVHLQTVYGVEIPEELEFAGERVPLELFDVKEALERELLSNAYFHSQTIRYIKLTHRYFPLIEPILKKNLVPDDFKYLAVAESGLSQAVSPARAVGFWQLLSGTAKDYGLTVNEQVDERYSVEKSTEVACEYLVDSYKKYANWTMTAASYNAGRRGVDRQITRQQADCYYDLLLNSETARYVYRVLALKLILENPEAYGFHLDEIDMYEPIPVVELEVDSTVTDFARFAKTCGTNYKMLKFLNPWLRDTMLDNPQGRTWHIQVPEEGYRRARSRDMED